MVGVLSLNDIVGKKKRRFFTCSKQKFRVRVRVRFRRRGRAGPGEVIGPFARTRNLGCM